MVPPSHGVCHSVCVCVCVAQEMYEPIDPIEEMTLSEEEEAEQEDYVDVQQPPLDQPEYTDVPPHPEVSASLQYVIDSQTLLSH